MACDAGIHHWAVFVMTYGNGDCGAVEVEAKIGVDTLKRYLMPSMLIDPMSPEEERKVLRTVRDQDLVARVHELQCCSKQEAERHAEALRMAFHDVRTYKSHYSRTAEIWVGRSISRPHTLAGDMIDSEIAVKRLKELRAQSKKRKRVTAVDDDESAEDEDDDE